jgi:hypothetical protein
VPWGLGAAAFCALKCRRHICLIKNLHSSGVTLVNKQAAMMHARQMQNLSRLLRLPFLRVAQWAVFAYFHRARAAAKRAHIIQPVSFDACYLAIILTHSLSGCLSALSIPRLKSQFFLLAACALARSLARSRI